MILRAAISARQRVIPDKTRQSRMLTERNPEMSTPSMRRFHLKTSDKRSLFIFNHIPDPPYRMNQLDAIRLFDLGPEVTDVNVDNIGLAFKIIAPDPFQQDLAFHHDILVFHQEL